VILVAMTLLVTSMTGVASATTPKPRPDFAPGASTTAYGGISVFYASGSRRLIHRSGTATAWGAVEDLDGGMTSGPAPITIGSEFAQTWAFIRGNDDALWYRVFSDGKGEWGPWSTAGGRFFGAPATSCVGDFTAEPIVYVRGTDNALWRYVLGGSWRRVGGVLDSEPGAVPAVGGQCPSREDVFVVGTDREVWEWTGGTSFHRLGGLTDRAPAAVEHPSGRTDLFARGVGADHSLWVATRASRTGAWSSWTRVGGSITTAPAATLLGTSPRTRRVFALGTDGDVWQVKNVVGTTTWTWREVP